MRLLKLGVYYDAYLKEFYESKVHIRTSSYKIQHAALMDDCFGSSDFWTVALSRLGYETVEIVANAWPLQQRWASDRELKYDEKNWMFDISIAQIVDFRPDIIIIADYSTFTEGYVRRLRECCPSLRLVLGWCGAPYHDPSVFRQWDVVLSCVPELVLDFQANGHDSRHLHHSFDPRVREKMISAVLPVCDFSFLGSIIRADQFHIGRDKIISYLMEHTALEVWSEAAPSAYRGEGDQAPAKSWLSRMHRPVFGTAMYRQVAGSRVSLNTHIDIAAQSASNMRLFETTGVGTCLLTDWKPNLHELFEPDHEVVAYRSLEECAEKVRDLLDNEPRRRAIAERGVRRTLRDHAVNVRVQQLDGIIRDALRTN